MDYFKGEIANEKISFKEILIIGLALFAALLEAGNSYISTFYWFNSRRKNGKLLYWDFSLTGIGLPILGVLAVTCYFRRVYSKFVE